MKRDQRLLGPLRAAFVGVTGSPPTQAQRLCFERYLELLVLWNRTHDLTGLRTPEAIVRGLFCDSLLFLPLLPATRPLKVLDLGSGAGIPGVPLRIADDQIRLTAVEARRKRVSFLSTLRRELRLEDIEIIHGRADRLLEERPELRNGQDVIVARASVAPSALLTISRPFLKPGGRLVASGPPRGAQRAKLPEGFKAEWREVEFPALGVVRTFLVSGNGS